MFKEKLDHSFFKIGMRMTKDSISCSYALVPMNTIMLGIQLKSCNKL